MNLQHISARDILVLGGRGSKIPHYQILTMGTEGPTSNQLTRLIILKQIFMKQSMRMWTYAVLGQDLVNTAMNIRVPENRRIWPVERLFNSISRTLLHGVSIYNTPFPSHVSKLCLSKKLTTLNLTWISSLMLRKRPSHLTLIDLILSRVKGVRDL
jgi:hypothetical protein